jgi:hypothetical protein
MSAQGQKRHKLLRLTIAKSTTGDMGKIVLEVAGIEDFSQKCEPLHTQST